MPELVPHSSLGNRSGLKWLEVFMLMRENSVAAKAVVVTAIIGALAGFFFHACVIMSSVAVCNVPCPGFLLFFLLVIGGAAIGPVIIGTTWMNRLKQAMDLPRLNASAERLRRGDTLDVTYTHLFHQQIEVYGLQLTLVLEEVATYTRGTDTVTERHEHVMQTVDLPGRTLWDGETFTGRASFTIPPDAMHTFESKNNKLRWWVKTEIRLSKWPNTFAESYQIVVEAGA